MSKVDQLRGLLCLLSRVKSRREIEDFLKQANKESLLLISEICLNLLDGKIPLTDDLITELKQYRNIIRHLRRKKVTYKERKAVLQTGEGLGLLFPLIFPTVADLILRTVFRK